jgi:hypothetical protein
MEQYRKFTQRDTKTGQPIKEAYPNGTCLNCFYQIGSYAEYKRKVLAEERKKYNVDILGRYKGGGSLQKFEIMHSSTKGQRRS